VIALFALWASSDLQGMRGFSFGAGTAPRMFAVLMLGLGIAVMVVGLVSEGPHLATYAWRGPLFVSLSILAFAITIRPLGLVFSAFASFMISALGTPETRWKETIIVGICLTIGCSLLFPYALGLPLQLFPRFLVQ
jgi:putative tricarboxylic transport membrane protein